MFENVFVSEYLKLILEDNEEETSKKSVKESSTLKTKIKILDIKDSYNKLGVHDEDVDKCVSNIKQSTTLGDLTKNLEEFLEKMNEVYKPEKNTANTSGQLSGQQANSESNGNNEQQATPVPENGQPATTTVTDQQTDERK